MSVGAFNPADREGCASDLGNIRAALAWAFAPAGDTSIAVALAEGSAPIWLEMSLLSECQGWMEKALDILDPDDRGSRRELVLQMAARHRAIITLEENVTAGGAGSAVGELLAAEGVAMPLMHIGIPDRFIEHGSREECLAAAGLDFASVSGAVERWWALQPQERSPTSKVG